MPFISVSPEMDKKSFTSVENKFITKYMPELEPLAVKVYLYALYVCQNSHPNFTLADFAQSLRITEEQARVYFEYLEEFELVSITSSSPFEVKILEAENVSGAPKRYKPEKYADFVKNVQDIIRGRMISPNEFREYFYLLEEYGFEQNALVMIIQYCVNLKGDDIRSSYIKKVAKTFAEEGATTAVKVDEKLSSYSSSTPALIRVFNAVNIKRQPDVDDDRLFKKWTDEMGFDEKAIIYAAKQFKAKSTEAIDAALCELYKNRKFDVKEIEDYCKTRNSVYALTFEISKNLGVYMRTAAPYVENYVNIWCNCGYSAESLKKLSVYCFKSGKGSYEDMNAVVEELYKGGVVDDASVENYLFEKVAEDKILREILGACGLTRKIIDWDRQALARWKSWNFTGDMLLEAAKISAGKSNPLAYMNAVLSSWKADGIFSSDKIAQPEQSIRRDDSRSVAAEIERHYSALRQKAEEKAEKTLKKAMDDPVYGDIKKRLTDANIKLAFAEIRDATLAEKLSGEIKSLEKEAKNRLNELGIDEADLSPRYQCEICGDTGYDKDGKPCKCLQEFLNTLK